MHSYSVKEIQNTQTDIFNRADIEPVLLTDESKVSYIIMSVKNYEQLMNRLIELEDFILGQEALAALDNSQMVGTEIFTAELKRMAANIE